ncbi:MAG: hypothetical protein QOE96_4316 [Blastocatellia bacterium]|jgi:hypothetical protein|nr:hypothetical protein [Blastocatellia bacterium]
MSVSEHTITPELADLSRKTGLIVRAVSPPAINTLFAEIEKFDANERAKTFEDLKHALNETRASVGAEPAFTE